MEQLIERFKNLDTTCVSDALDSLGIECCVFEVKPIQRGFKICGTAFTVHYTPCGIEYGTVGDFLDDVTPGQIIVLDNNGRENCTVWGDIMSRAARKKGIEGTVIDGVCRDIPAAISCGYPIFSKGYYMRTGKDRVYADGINVPVTISDIPIYPGDIILGDDSGVVVIPQSKAERVLEIAEEIDQKEREIVELVERGYSLREARAIKGYHRLQTKKQEN